MEKKHESPQQAAILSRIDKNIAQNSFNFSQYGSEENLIRDFVIYMCIMYQSRKDLFGFMIADPKKFAKEMNIKSPNFLFAHADEPAQAKKEGQKKFDQMLEKDPQKAFVTRFENALYKMFTEPLILSEGGHTKEGNSYIQLDKIDLIKAVKIIYDKNNRNKKYYEFVPGDNVINNLSLFYTFFNYQTYTALSNRLRSFYLFLCNVKYNLVFETNKNFEYSFDAVCRRLNIKSGEPKERKKRIVKSFNEFLKVDPNFGIKLEWATAGRWDYKPVFILDKDYVRDDVPDRKAVKQDIFINEYILGVSADFKGLFYLDLEADNENFLHANGKVKDHFKLWLNDPKQGIATKRANYIHAAQKAWGDKYEIIDYKIDKFIFEHKFDMI